MIRKHPSFSKVNYYKFIPILVGMFLLLPIKIFAVGPIVINEIMYDLEGTDSGYEWVELKNVSNEAIDLNGWKFNDGSNHLLNVPPKNGGQGLMIIPPQGYVILADKADLFLQTHLDFSGTVIDTVMSLNNTSAMLKLIDANGNVVEEITYDKLQGANGNGFSLERVADNVLNFCESNIKGGTPGQPNNFNCNKAKETSTPMLTPTPSVSATPTLLETPPLNLVTQVDEENDEENIISVPSPQVIKVRLIINEFLPDPVGNDQEGEWVEIYNDSDTDVVLKGWRLEDASGQKYYFKDEVIKQKDFLVLPYKTTKITLNNNGETLSLYSPNNELAFQISYNGKAKEGYSYARVGPNNWQWTSILTSGSSNQFSGDSKKAQTSTSQNSALIESIIESSEQSRNKNEASISNSKEQLPNQNTSNNFSFSEKIILVAIGIGLIISIASVILIKHFLP